MTGAVRSNIDTVTGPRTIRGITADTVKIENEYAIVIGDTVDGGTVMAQGSDTVFVYGIAVCRQGDIDTANCAATGSSTVIIG